MVHFKIEKFKIERDMLLIGNGHKFSNEMNFALAVIRSTRLHFQ